ncbi:hypothetical protein OIU76_021645 [Salix suchowensis]|nr:hypothetical protein OIU76_021645 [Salix suchowensis]
MMMARIMRTPSYQPVPGPSSLIPKPRDSAADTMRRKMVYLLLDFMSNSKKFLAAGTGVLCSALALRRLRSSPSPSIPLSKSVPSASAIPRTPPNACKESRSRPRYYAGNVFMYEFDIARSISDLIIPRDIKRNLMC